MNVSASSSSSRSVKAVSSHAQTLAHTNVNARPTRSTSKYDFVKVRVWLGEAVKEVRESYPTSCVQRPVSPSSEQTCVRDGEGDLSSLSTQSTPHEKSNGDDGAASEDESQKTGESRRQKNECGNLGQHSMRQQSHYYVLSRFLISRTLTSILIPPHDAVILSLDLKKHLVDNDRFDISQVR